MKKFVLVLMLFLLFIGVSHADLLTDGSFEHQTFLNSQKICYKDIYTADCSLSGADQTIRVPEYWSLDANFSVGFYYAGLIDNAMDETFGTEGQIDVSTFYSCTARNCYSFANLTGSYSVFEYCSFCNNIEIPLPFYYVQSVSSEGDRALVVHNIPQLECGRLDSTHCGQKNTSSYGFVYQNVTLSNANYKLSFDVRNCDFTPSQCPPNEGDNSWWCKQSTYGNPKDKTLGNFKVVIANDTTFSNIYTHYEGSADYRTGWHHYDLDLSGMGQSGNMTIGLGIYSVSESSSICVIYDNVSLTAVTPVVVPSTYYINDMKTYIGFPITYSSHNPSAGFTLSAASSITSVGYDGVTMINTSYQIANSIYWTKACVIGVCTDVYTVTLHYKNGSYTTLSAALEDHKLACDLDGSGWVTMFYLIFEHSIPDPENLDYIDYYFMIQKYDTGCQSGTRSIYTNVSFDQDITTREKYSNVLEGDNSDDVITGVPYLYPVLIYNNYINSSGCQFWTSYNFKTVAEAYTNNVEYTLYSSSGSPKQWGAESVSFPVRNGTHNFCWLDMTGVDYTDYIVTVVSSDFFSSLAGITNLSVRFPVTASGINLCVSRCIPTTTREQKTLLDSGACQIETIYNSSLCIAEIGGFVPPTSGNWSWWTNLTGEIGNASDNFFNTANVNFPAFLKFLIAIIVTLIVPLILATKVIKGDHGGIVYITIFLAISLFFTLWGYSEGKGWLPPIFLIIDVIIFILLVGVFGRKAITGG